MIGWCNSKTCRMDKQRFFNSELVCKTVLKLTRKCFTVRCWILEIGITMGTWFRTPQIQSPSHHNKPFVRMCSSGTHFPNFADIGDTVILFVNFGPDCKPVARENLVHALTGATAVWESPTQHYHDDEDDLKYEVITNWTDKPFSARRVILYLF